MDYIPSRGAVNQQGDTWIPMDASFKQYQFTPGLDFKSPAEVKKINSLPRFCLRNSPIFATGIASIGAVLLQVAETILRI